MTNICDYCKKGFSRNDSCQRHLKICKVKKQLDDKKNEEKVSELEIKEEEINVLKQKIKQKEKELKQKDEFIAFQKNLLENTKKEINNSQTNNITINTSLSLQELMANIEPINFDDINNSIHKFTDKYIDKGFEGYAKFLCEHPCKKKFVTTDNARSVIAYKTSENIIVKDPDAQKLFNKSLRENADSLLKKINYRKQYLDEKLDKNITELETYEIDKQQRIIDDVSLLKQGIEQTKKNEIISNKKAIKIIKKKGLENVQQNTKKEITN